MQIMPVRCRAGAPADRFLVQVPWEESWASRCSSHACCMQVIKRQHMLLVTLLLCNAAATEVRA